MSSLNKYHWWFACHRLRTTVLLNQFVSLIMLELNGWNFISDEGLLLNNISDDPNLIYTVYTEFILVLISGSLWFHMQFKKVLNPIYTIWYTHVPVLTPHQFRKTNIVFQITQILRPPQLRTPSRNMISFGTRTIPNCKTGITRNDT